MFGQMVYGIEYYGWDIETLFMEEGRAIHWLQPSLLLRKANGTYKNIMNIYNTTMLGALEVVMKLLTYLATYQRLLHQHDANGPTHQHR